jgi:hypothetical protein
MVRCLETPTNQNINFITGAGAFLEQFLYEEGLFAELSSATALKCPQADLAQRVGSMPEAGHHRSRRELSG